jgi:hypothetical protein
VTPDGAHVARLVPNGLSCPIGVAKVPQDIVVTRRHQPVAAVISIRHLTELEVTVATCRAQVLGALI